MRRRGEGGRRTLRVEGEREEEHDDERRQEGDEHQ
jgi:hypothetical protein